MREAFVAIIFVTSTLFALIKGGAPERTTAAIFIFMMVSDPFVHEFTPERYNALDPGHLIIDLIGWIAICAIAMRANRLWPLCVAALQTISVMSHLVRMIDYSIHPAAYAIMQVASSYPLLLTLSVGTYMHQKRMSMNGSDPAWSD
jgi:hypothetical protein